MTIRKLSGLALHVLLSAVLAVLAAMLAHGVVFRSQEAAQLDQAAAYIRIRAEHEDRLFDDASLLVRTASRVFRRRLANQDPSQVDSAFNRLFPVHPDGTRRSAPELWDGLDYRDGDQVYGVGAFLGDGARMTADERQRYLAAFHTVRTVGEAHLSRFSSLYFFTPDRRMVMFAPDRPDNLLFYRVEAPADFPLQADEDPDLFDLRTNPSGAMMCTRLSRFVYDDGGARAASACRMPVRRGDQLLGAFGTSIMMNDYLTEVLADPPAHGMNMLFDRDGQVITRGDQMHIGAFETPTGSPLEPAEVFAQIGRDPRPVGTFRARSSDHVIAFSRIDGPRWIFASVIDLGPARAVADVWACILLATVFVASLVFSGMRWLIVRLRPVRRLYRARRRRDREPAIHLGVQHTSL